MAKEKDPEYNTEWTDDMIERFLTATQRDGDNNDPDFDAAVYAFRFIPAWVFDRYAAMFVAAGKNINAKNVKGQTILQYLQQFSRAGDYADVWQEIGGQ